MRRLVQRVRQLGQLGQHHPRTGQELRVEVEGAGRPGRPRRSAFATRAISPVGRSVRVRTSARPNRSTAPRVGAPYRSPITTIAGGGGERGGACGRRGAPGRALHRDLGRESGAHDRRSAPGRGCARGREAPPSGERSPRLHIAPLRVPGPRQDVQNPHRSAQKADPSAFCIERREPGACRPARTREIPAHIPAHSSRHQARRAADRHCRRPRHSSGDVGGRRTPRHPHPDGGGPHRCPWPRRARRCRTADHLSKGA